MIPRRRGVGRPTTAAGDPPSEVLSQARPSCCTRRRHCPVLVLSGPAASLVAMAALAARSRRQRRLRPIRDHRAVRRGPAEVGAAWRRRRRSSRRARTRRVTGSQPRRAAPPTSARRRRADFGAVGSFGTLHAPAPEPSRCLRCSSSRRWSPRRAGDDVRGRRGRPPRAASVRRSDARRGNASFDVIAGGDRRLANAGGARAAEVVAAGARTAARAGEPGAEKPTFSSFGVAALRRDGVQGSGAAIPAPQRLPERPRAGPGCRHARLGAPRRVQRATARAPRDA